MKKHADIKLAYPVIEAGVDADIMAMKALNGYDETFALLHQMGYQGIELQVRNPEDVDVSMLESALEKYNLTLAAIGTSPMQKMDHMFLLGKDRELCSECFHCAESLISLCAHFHSVMLIGKMRGMVDDKDGCRMSDLKRIISTLTDRASMQRVCIALEPQNVTNINNLNICEEADAFIKSLNVKPGILGIHADFYHMEISEPNMLESIERYKSLIRFIHVSDTERKVPGEGRMDCVSVIKKLINSGYQGYLSPEIQQLPESELAAKRTIMKLEGFLQ